MHEEQPGSGGWDGVERRKNPVGRLLWSREVRAMMRELGGGRQRFRREPDHLGDDDAPAGSGNGPEAPPRGPRGRD